MVPVIVTDGAELKDIVTFEELEEFALLMFKYIREYKPPNYELFDVDSVAEKVMEKITGGEGGGAAEITLATEEQIDEIINGTAAGVIPAGVVRISLATEQDIDEMFD